MKIWLLLLPFVLLVFACATAPPVEEAEPGQEKEAVQAAEEPPEMKVEGEQQVEKAERVITETLYLVIREESLSTDGFVDRFIEYVYEKEGIRLLEEKVVGIDGVLEKQMVYEYDGDQLEQMGTYDSSGDLMSYHQYLYNNAGLLVSDSLFNGKKELQVQSLYEYDDQQRKTDWTVKNSSELIQAITRYQYGKYSQPDKIEMFTPSGTLESYVDNEFDSDGNLVREVYGEADGSIWKYIEYIYSDGVLEQENHYSGKKALKRKVFYKYDDNGNIASVVYTGPGGAVQDTRTKQYTTRTVDRVVVE